MGNGNHSTQYGESKTSDQGASIRKKKNKATEDRDDGFLLRGPGPWSSTKGHCALYLGTKNVISIHQRRYRMEDQQSHVEVKEV